MSLKDFNSMSFCPPTTVRMPNLTAFKVNFLYQFDWHFRWPQNFYDGWDVEAILAVIPLRKTKFLR